MRISDWSSDVCSSDLVGQAIVLAEQQGVERVGVGGDRGQLRVDGGGHVVVELGEGGQALAQLGLAAVAGLDGDRKSVVEGKSVSVRVDLGGRRIIKKKRYNLYIYRRAIS